MHTAGQPCLLRESVMVKVALASARLITRKILDQVFSTKALSPLIFLNISAHVKLLIYQMKTGLEHFSTQFTLSKN